MAIAHLLKMFSVVLDLRMQDKHSSLGLLTQSYSGFQNAFPHFHSVHKSVDGTVGHGSSWPKEAKSNDSPSYHGAL